MSFKTFIEPKGKVIVNIVVTFVQAAFATFIASGGQFDKLAVAGAVGAGVSAVWNVVIKPWLVFNGYLRGKY